MLRVYTRGGGEGEEQGEEVKTQGVSREGGRASRDIKQAVTQGCAVC